MKKSVEAAFERLSDELLLAMAGNYTPLADSILYGNLVTDIEDVRYKYARLIGRTGKKEVASGVTSTESDHGNKSPLHTNSIIIITIGVKKEGMENGNE